MGQAYRMNILEIPYSNQGRNLKEWNIEQMEHFSLRKKFLQEVK
jgi:hypothetical protein